MQKMIERVFIFFVFFIVYLPMSEIRNISFHQIILWIFIFYFYVRNKIKIKKEEFLIFIFITLEAILIFFYYDYKNINFLNNNIPEIWFEMGGWEKFSYFKGQYESIAQLVHILENLLIYFIFKFKMNITEKQLKKTVLLNFIFQFSVILYQKFILNIFWQSGTLGHSQAIGTFCVMILILFGFSNKKNKTISILSIVLTFISKKNSSMAVVIFIMIFYKYSLLALYLSALGNIILTILFSWIEKLKIIFFSLIKFLFRDGSLYTLKMRYIIWEDIFFLIIKKNFLLGTNGIIVSFPENVIWYFLQPYGIVGIIIILYLFFHRCKYKAQKHNLLLSAFFLQGISYYGFLVPPVSYMFFSLLGLYSKEKVENKNEKVKWRG